MMLVDSHAHLDSPVFSSDLPDVLMRARQAGIKIILTIGCLDGKPVNVERVLALIQDHSNVYASFGVHPHDAACFTDQLRDQLASLAEHPRVLAVGEIGLDFYYDNSPREQQRDVFLTQIRLARAKNLPVIIHTRDAFEETIQILEEEFSAGDSRSGVLHCFTGDAAMAHQCIDLGFYIGLGGIVTFRKSEALRAVVASLPQDRFVVETDSPYLAPVPHRGKRNEPAYTRLVAETIAEIRETSLENIASWTTRNFEDLFAAPAISSGGESDQATPKAPRGR